MEVEEPVLLVVMGDMTLVLGRPWHILHFLHPTVTTVRSYIVCGTYYVPTHLDPGGEGTSCVRGLRKVPPLEWQQVAGVHGGTWPVTRDL